jgi:hypothetical protein
LVGPSLSSMNSAVNAISREVNKFSSRCGEFCAW